MADKLKFALVAISVFAIGASAACANQTTDQVAQVTEAIDTCATLVRSGVAQSSGGFSADSVTEHLSRAGWRVDESARSDFPSDVAVVMQRPESDAVAIGVARRGGCWISGPRGVFAQVSRSVEQNTREWTRIPEDAPEGYNLVSFVSAEPVSEGRHLLLMLRASGMFGDLRAMVANTRWPPQAMN